MIVIAKKKQTAPYKNIILTPEGFFKTRNNRVLNFSLTDVKRIYKHLQLPGCDIEKLIEYSNLSEHVTRRIVESIKNGIFNEYLNIQEPKEEETVEDTPDLVEDILQEFNDDTESPQNIVINDGINIVINNNYINQNDEVKKSLPNSETVKKQVKEQVKTKVKNTRHVTKKMVRDWSKKIRRRDNYTCANCGVTDKNGSQAHHIYPQSRYPELACEEGNGITLCSDCHTDYHQRYQGSENPYNFTRWLNEFRLEYGNKIL